MQATACDKIDVAWVSEVSQMGFSCYSNYFDAWEERHVLRNGHNLFVCVLHAMLVSEGTLINVQARW